MDVTTEEGDLLFFPAFWWHSVKNKGTGFQFGCGFRPQLPSVRKQLLAVALPPLAGPNLNLYVAHLPATAAMVARRLLGSLLPHVRDDYEGWWKNLPSRGWSVTDDVQGQ